MWVKYTGTNKHYLPNGNIIQPGGVFEAIWKEIPKAFNDVMEPVAAPANAGPKVEARTPEIDEAPLEMPRRPGRPRKSTKKAESAASEAEVTTPAESSTGSIFD